jgi:hypothetical protein
MLDYEEVKAVYADKMASDTKGRGRMDAAFFAAIRFAYLRGLEDGRAEHHQPQETYHELETGS